MTTSRLRAPGGQLTLAASVGELRSRVHSGFRDRSTRDLRFLIELESLAELIADVGAPCWVWGETAGALCSFDGFQLRPPFHVAIPRDRNVRRMGHVIHTVHVLDRIDTAVVHGLPCTSPTRTVIDLAGIVSRERLTTALDSALRDGATSDDFLHRRINALRNRGRRGINTLLDVIDGHEVTRGGHSWLEREFLRLVARAGLPRPCTQQVLGVRHGRLIRVDCHFPGTNVVVELLGYRFHRSVMQMQSDAERMNRLLLDGHRVLQFTYTDVVSHPDTIVATITEAWERPPRERLVRT